MSAILEEAAKALNYLIEEDRRKTFKKWHFNEKDKCNADKMAESGFIFIGNKSEPDAVKCFFCNKGLDGWDPTDDPWQEHIKHSPKCSFAKLQKSQDNMKMKEFLAIKDELMEKIIESYIEDKANKIGEFENYEKIIMSKINKS